MSNATKTTKPRMTTQRAIVLSVIERRTARGLPTCAADVTRLVWGGRGHAATYSVISGLIRCGLLQSTRDGNRKLLTLTT